MRAPRLLPPPGPARTLAVAQLISTIGNGAYYVCAALYFTRIVGLSPVQLGAGLTIAGAIGMLAGVPLGHLADRHGARIVAALLTAGAGIGCTAYLVVRSFDLFVVAACGFAICQRGAIAARQALLAGLVSKEERTMTRAMLQSTYNAGLTVGAVGGGIALRLNTPHAYLAAFALDAASFFFAAVILLRVPNPVPVGADRRKLAGRLDALRDRPYALITCLNMIMVFYLPLIDVALPLWVVRETKATSWMVAVLFGVTTISVVAFQVPIARAVTDLDSASRSIRRGGVLLLAACVTFAASAAGSSAWVASLLLLAATGLQVLGQMVQYSGVWEISFGLAPADRHGQYQGLFGTGPAAAEMLGPLVLTTLVVSWGYPGWLVLGAAFALAGAAMRPAVRWAEATRQPERISVEA